MKAVWVSLRGRGRSPQMERLVLLLGTLLVFFLCTRMLPLRNTLLLTTDEQGPFAVAAWLSGVDWSSTTKEIAYYSYGYSFLLWPLFIVFRDSTMLYKAAAVLNALFISAIPIISWRCTKRFPQFKKRYLTIAVSVCIALYANNIARAHLALNEALLILCCWVLFALFIRLGQRPKWYHFVLTGLLLVYVYMIHQRMLGVLAAGIFTIVLMRLKKQITTRQLLLAAGAVIVMLVFHTIFKGIVKAEVWKNSNASQWNDFSSIYKNTLNLLSMEGILRLFRGMAGQIYYIGTASFLLCFFGVAYAARHCLRQFKGPGHGEPAARIIAPETPPLLFLLLAVAFTFAISVLFMNAAPTRADHVVYGRYNEPLYGPLMLLAFGWMLDGEGKKGRVVFWAGAALVLSGIVTNTLYGDLRNAYFSDISCVGIAPFYYDEKLHIYESVAAALAGALILFFSARVKRVYAVCLSLALLTGCFVYTGGYTVTHDMVGLERMWYQGIQNMTETVKRDEEGRDIYYLGPEGNDLITSLIQFSLKDRPLLYILEDDLSSVNKPHYLVVPKEAPFRFLDRYDVVMEANDVSLLKFVGVQEMRVKEYPLSTYAFKFQSGKSFASWPAVSDGTAGHFMYGPYITLRDPGIYTVMMEVSLSDAEASQREIGLIDLYSEGKTLALQNLYTEDLDASGGMRVSLKAWIPEPMDNFEIRVYTAAGARLAIHKISIAMAEAANYKSDLNLRAFFLTEAVFQGGMIVSSGKAGYVLYGPYMFCPAGEYTAKVSMRVLENRWGHATPITADVAAGHGETILAQFAVSPAEDGTLDLAMPFVLDDEVSDLEIRVYQEDGVTVEVDAVSLVSR